MCFSFVEKSQVLMEQRNEGLLSSANQTQHRVLSLEQEKVILVVVLVVCIFVNREFTPKTRISLLIVLLLKKNITWSLLYYLCSVELWWHCFNWRRCRILIPILYIQWYNKAGHMMDKVVNDIIDNFIHDYKLEPIVKKLLTCLMKKLLNTM